MKRILRFFCGTFTVAMLLCVLWGININSLVNETGIEGSKVHFKMPGIVLPLLNGNHMRLRNTVKPVRRNIFIMIKYCLDRREVFSTAVSWVFMK